MEGYRGPKHKKGGFNRKLFQTGRARTRVCVCYLTLAAADNSYDNARYHAPTNSLPLVHVLASEVSTKALVPLRTTIAVYCWNTLFDVDQTIGETLCPITVSQLLVLRRKQNKPNGLDRREENQKHTCRFSQSIT